jgi:hypothetical protein
MPDSFDAGEIETPPRPEANPDLLRIAFKLATGAGKATVMACSSLGRP